MMNLGLKVQVPRVENASPGYQNFGVSAAKRYR